MLIVCHGFRSDDFWDVPKHDAGEREKEKDCTDVYLKEGVLGGQRCPRPFRQSTVIKIEQAKQTFGDPQGSDHVEISAW